MATPLLRLVASDGGTEARVSHPGGVPIRDGLQQDRILSDFVPVNLRQIDGQRRSLFQDGAGCTTHVLEVLLLQDGEEEAGHGVVTVGRHGSGRGLCGVDEMGCRDEDAMVRLEADEIAGQGCPRQRETPQQLCGRGRIPDDCGDAAVGCACVLMMVDG